MKLKFAGLFAVLVVLAMALTGCMTPYDKPEIITIEASQSAFLIPLDGKTSDQAGFMSENYLQQAKVATKQIQIPHRFIQDGYNSGDGHYIGTMKLIVVERKPETREWTESNATGTSAKNEGIVAESKESIGFMARMNATAQIDESNAVKFLFRYNNKSLADIMDQEVRARVESDFVEQCASRSLDSILLEKQKIMDAVRADVTPYFAERGITITTLGLKGEFTYLNQAIQDSIDKKFTTEQALISQKNMNEQTISKAQADAQAQIIQAKAIADSNTLISNSLSANVISNKWLDKWNGVMPTYMGGGNMMPVPTVDVATIK